MARLPRLYAPGEVQHIIQRGNNRQEIFRDEADFRRFTEILNDAARAHRFALHAYVLLPDHLHLLGRPADEHSVPRLMQTIGRGHVRHFNDKYRRTGTLWDGRYRATLVESEHYVLACMQYIETNPVRTGLVDLPRAWPWSSYAHHAGLAPNPLITDPPAYWALGNTPFDRQAAYLARCAEPMPASLLEQIRSATNKGWILGSARFAARLQESATRRPLPLPKGRPPTRTPK